jgi:uncharacterized membrane protein YkgB
MLAKKFALGFGIAVIFPVMIHYGVSTFVPAPKWQDYYQTYSYQEEKEATPVEKAKIREQRKQSEEQRKMQEKRFQKALFLVTVPLGIATIIIGSLVLVNAIGAGLMFGGIFSLLDGYFVYWSQLADWMRFCSLLLAFSVLLFIGFRKLEK